MKKIVIDGDRQNLCELAKKALEQNGIKSTILLDKDGKYMIKIENQKEWKGE